LGNLKNWSGFEGQQRFDAESPQVQMVGWGGGSIPLAYRGHVTNAPADSRVERRTGRLPASSTFPLAPAQLVRPCREADSLPPGDRALLVVDRRHSDCPHL